MRKKHKNIDGQRPLTGLPQAIEAANTHSARPKGMPSLAILKTEMARHGYPDSDAEYLYDCWLASGFTLKSNGKPIKDWKAAFRLRARNGWLPSQRKAEAQSDRAKEREAAELARLRRISNGDH
jgi:hypothetical protein